MIPCVLEVELRINERSIRDRGDEATEDIKTFGNWVWFHREKELAFLDIGRKKGMVLALALNNDSEESREYAHFVIKKILYLEGKEKYLVRLAVDKYWDVILPRDMDQKLWTLGDYTGTFY